MVDRVGFVEVGCPAAVGLVLVVAVEFLVVGGVGV